MSNNKIKLGQFFTKENTWLKKHIHEFILTTEADIAYDPFAGAGDLIKISEQYGIYKTKGLDIDKELNWEINDSLVEIPSIKNAIIVTNPPYLAKQSASRKKLVLTEYFDNTTYDDLYLIALDKMIEAQKYVVAIIPESFINSNYKQKHLLHSITILEDNPFEDTEVPVCVVCFDGEEKPLDQIKVYKNDLYINSLQKIEDVKLIPSNGNKITFNDLSGWLGIRAVDSTDDHTFIKFDFKENIKYDWENKIKVSSRHYTLVNIDVPQIKKEKFLDKCNEILSELRKESKDIVLTPFMGNTKKGIRRRRLDFRLARAIMEKAYKEIL